MKKRVFLFLVAALVVNDFAVIIGSIKIFGIITSPSLVSVINAPIKDQTALKKIVLRIKQEGIKTSISRDGLIKVADEKTARRVRTLLIQEELIPMDTDPWALFDRERWTATIQTNDINFQHA